MRMGELSRQSGVSVSTIKYYLREGLLPAGRRSAANQADYGAEHLERIELIRALREIAGLPIATIAAALAVADRPAARRRSVDPIALALSALSAPLAVPAAQEALYADADARVTALAARAGWLATSEAGARADLVRALVAIERHFPGGVSDEALAGYAQVAARLAEREIPDDWNPAGAPFDALRYAVLGTVLFEPLILALRRLAHADRHRRLGRGRAGAARPTRSAGPGPSRSGPGGSSPAEPGGSRTGG